MSYREFLMETKATISYKVVGDKVVFQKNGVHFALTKQQLPEMKAAIEKAIEETK